MIIDIDKIYNPPAAIKRPQPITTANNEQSSLNDTFDQQASRDYYSNYFRRGLIVFKNFDLFRSTGLVAAMIMIHAIITPTLSSC
jgi:phosphatidylethanolamine N-methyltransferase